tara:strand:- start:2544 stop:3143 length:600 start_codon:yes stop_codon:yes gene_type:complete
MENIELSNLTVGQYQLLAEIDPKLTAIEQNIYAVAAIKNITYNEARDITMKEFNNIVTAIERIDVKELEKGKINNRVNIGGKLYWIENDPSKLTSGQLLDIINIRANSHGEPLLVMDLIIAALCKPLNGKYGDDDMTLNERAALCRSVKVAEVWNLFIFFYQVWNNYLAHTEDSLTEWMEEVPTKVRKILDESGDSSPS